MTKTDYELTWSVGECCNEREANRVKGDLQCCACPRWGHDPVHNVHSLPPFILIVSVQLHEKQNPQSHVVAGLFCYSRKCISKLNK